MSKLEPKPRLRRRLNLTIAQHQRLNLLPGHNHHPRPLAKKQKTTKPDALDLSIDSIPDLLLEEQSSMPTSSPQLEEVDKEPTSGSEPDVQSAPQQLQPAAPRYFMRGAKRQHNEATDGERAGKIRKIVQAML